MAHTHRAGFSIIAAKNIRFIVIPVTYIIRKDIARNIRILTVEVGIKPPVFDPMKCMIKVANTAQIGERTTRHAF
jgi:hypothetical protein